MTRTPDFSAILSGLTCNGLTQADIARRLHLDPSTVCRMINGEIRSPSYANGLKIMSLHTKSLKLLVSTLNR